MVEVFEARCFKCFLVVCYFIFRIAGSCSWSKSSAQAMIEFVDIKIPQSKLKAEVTARASHQRQQRGWRGYIFDNDAKLL